MAKMDLYSQVDPAKQVPDGFCADEAVFAGVGIGAVCITVGAMVTCCVARVTAGGGVGWAACVVGRTPVVGGTRVGAGVAGVLQPAMRLNRVSIVTKVIAPTKADLLA